MAELDDQLTEVNAAIKTLLVTGEGVSSYAISTPGGGSRTVTRTDLTSLRAWRKELEREIGRRDSRAVRGGSSNAAYRGRP